MGLFGFRREVHLFWADSRRSAVEAADEADDTASVDSRTANAQGLYLRFILYNNELTKRQIEPNESNRSPTTRFKSANTYVPLVLLLEYVSRFGGERRPSSPLIVTVY